MKLCLFVFSFLLGILPLWADELKVEINPPKPVAGEVFQAYFRIFTDADEEPVINFSPSSLEVVGKSNQGISTRTIYANGKLTVTREMTFVYDLVANRPGFAALRDITVQIGSRTLRHPMVNLNVLKEPEVMPEVFVMADVPKKSVFLGEGFTVRYYLYSKVPLNNADVKKYPKLNNFLKRFLSEPDRSERVSVDGQIYLRNLIYAAKVFPEKVGELKIDGLELSATFMVSRPGDPFGNLGFNRDLKTRTLTSETVKVEVKPLPEEGKPAHFTGLVGKHDFDIQFGNTRLIVNEPLEVKLTITGGGALENLEAPTLLKHPALEEFESNGDLKIMDANQATKVFDYTFLAKENLKLPASQITLSYFDPDQMKYVPVHLSIPEIVVAGAGAQVPKTQTPAPEAEPEPSVKKTPTPVVPLELAAPVTKELKSWKSWINWLNAGLAALALTLTLGWMLRERVTLSLRTSNSNVPSSFKKGKFELSEFTKWITPLIQATGKSPMVLIKESDLSPGTKNYFTELLNANSDKTYSNRKDQLRFEYVSSHFKELGRYIESVKDESSI